MTTLTGRVVNGKIEVDDDSLPEGAIVTVHIHDDEETFEPTPEEEAMLLAAIAEADRGEFVSWAELLNELRSRR
jgi:hypothetical protein